MSKPKKNSKSASGKKVEPENGDIINVIHSSFETVAGVDFRFWDWTYEYRKEFKDRNGQQYKQAVIYDTERSLTNGMELAGTFFCDWNDVVFWRKWEGETRSEWRERVKDMKVTVIEWSNGKTAIKGDFGPTQIGPAFIPEPVDDSWELPKDGEAIEVHSRDDNQKHIGTFLRAANRFCNYHGVPALPFSRWIAFRMLDKDRKPVSEWLPGPHSEEWKAEEAERMQGQGLLHPKTYDELIAESNKYIETLGHAALEAGPEEFNEFEDRVTSGEFNTAQSVRNSNEKLYNARSAKVRKETKHDSDTVKLEQWKRFLLDVPTIPFIPLFEPEGKGAFFREKLRKDLSDKISIFEAARRMNPVTIAASEAMEPNDNIGGHGPYNKTVSAFASVAKMSEGGVRGPIRKTVTPGVAKIRGVPVYFIRNEGKKSQILISEISYSKMEKKMSNSAK